MTENQRRAHDLLTMRDLFLRSLAVVGLIVVTLAALLAAQPL